MALRFLANPAMLAHGLRTTVRSVSVAAREVLSALPDAEITTLKNGFRVISENNARTTATVGVWIEAGSRFETDENNGTAHFLEHMLYKGTVERSQSQLESELESIGARLSSYTSREHTAFYAQCASKDIEKVVDILADAVRNSKLNEAAIEKERMAILKELDEAETVPHKVVFDNLHAAAFQGTAMARPIYGPTKNIKSMSRDQLRNFAEDNYLPVRMVLSAVGGVDHSELVKLSEKYFGDLSNAYKRKVPSADGVRFTGSEYRYRNDYVPMMYCAVAVEGVGANDPDVIPLQLASTIVGQWDRTYGANVNSPSRLVQKVSVGLNLQQLQSFSLNYKDCGLFGVYFVHPGTELNESDEIIRAVQREWTHMSTSATEDELDRAKNMLKTNLLVLLESNSARADDIAKQVLHSGKIKSLATLERDIEAVDSIRLREAMDRNVYDRDIASAGFGRTEAFPNYHYLRYGMSWWRM